MVAQHRKEPYRGEHRKRSVIRAARHSPEVFGKPVSTKGSPGVVPETAERTSARGTSRRRNSAFKLPKGSKNALGLGMDSTQIVTGAFVLCVLITLAEGFTGTDKHGSDSDKDWAHHLLVRELAVCVVFLIVALVAMMGNAGSKIAVGLSLLISVSALLNSEGLVNFVASHIEPTEKSVT